MRLGSRIGCAGLALVFAGTARAQWFEDFDTYSAGALVDPGGERTIGNGWESWSTGLGSSIVTAAPPLPLSPPFALANVPGADTVNDYGPGAFTFPRFRFQGWVYHPAAYVGRTYWILLNTYSFGGPYDRSVQVSFDGDQNLVDCVCAGRNRPAGPPPLMRDTWVRFGALIDFEWDIVDVVYDGYSLTGGQEYVWTRGVTGQGTGLLELQALELYPDVVGAPHTTAIYYDDLSVEVPLCCTDPGRDPLCIPTPTSYGLPAEIELTGSGFAGEDLFGTCRNGPPGRFGYFLTGPNRGLYVIPPGAYGPICIAGPQYRYASVSLGQVFRFDTSGVSQAVSGGGPSVLPTDGSYPGVPAVEPGIPRVFQAWFREVGDATNFSGSYTVTLH